jgi:cytoskeletal protein RodZ
VEETNSPLNSKGIYLVLDFILKVKFFVQDYSSIGGKSPRYLATQTLLYQYFFNTISKQNKTTKKQNNEKTKQKKRGVSRFANTSITLWFIFILYFLKKLFQLFLTGSAKSKPSPKIKKNVINVSNTGSNNSRSRTSSNTNPNNNNNNTTTTTSSIVNSANKHSNDLIDLFIVSATCINCNQAANNQCI